MTVLFLFLVLNFCIPFHEVDARCNVPALERQYSFSRSQDRESNLLTIDNDFHCIDIYKQPAFNNPLLKNHKIQFNPTFATQMQRRLPKGKGCLPGKVPIHKLKTMHQMNTNSSSELVIKDFRQYSQSYLGHHFATLETTTNTTYHGASARFGPYNLSIQANQYSISQFWLQSGPPTELNSIQVGWGVHPSLYGDRALRLTTSWTVDNYEKTGCFNNLCPGFVQLDPSCPLGVALNGSNVIGSHRKGRINVKVTQDKSTGHWWLIVSDYIQVGFWPKEIFNHLSDGSSLIKYGGETFSPPNMLSPPMGSGELPKTLYENSTFIAKLAIVDSEYNEKAVHCEDMKSSCDTSSNCYDILYNGYEGKIYGQAFLFGGPGGQCGI